MRITNQMITDTTLRNMQKTMQASSDRYNEMTTGKKIQRASEDPVIAVRALKLRTTVSQLSQYKDKNIKDAESWLDTTTTSITNVVKRLQDVSTYCTQGATDSFSTTDRSSIVDSLKGLKDMIYTEGGTKYAGRYIFSGYKTDTNLVFESELSKEGVSYDITQDFTVDDIKSKSIVSNQLTAKNVVDIAAGTSTYTTPTEASVHRIKLAYDNLQCDEATPATTTIGLNVDGVSVPIITINKANSDAYYTVGANNINYIPETGELILGENVFAAIQNADKISVSYAKESFEVGDLRPEHYFDCTKHAIQSDGTVKDTVFTQPEGGQDLNYEVNFSQTVTVNTEGKDVITHNMGNAILDMAQAVQDVLDAESMKTKLTAMLGDSTYSSNSAAVGRINKMLEDIDIELALKKENMQSLFGANTTNFKDYISDVTAQQSKSATRSNKLDLISERVTEQYANFKELMSSNEDIETEEAIIAYNQAEQVYNLALSATADVIQKTLLDYM